MEMQQDMQLAVLIDAENVPYSNVTGMLEEITRYGTPTVKRIYGDWTTQNMSGWKNVLVPNAIMPVQQYCYTSGKNSSDSAMIIDAMDILYAGKIDGFCLVSSDSDFTRLATRLRESGKKVYGFGEKKTPDAFIAACDKFIYLEIIASAEQDTDSSGTTGDNTPKRREISKVDRQVIQLISNSVSDLANEDGWAFLGEVGSLILKKKPDFDSRNYGFSKLSLLVESTKKYELDIRERGHKGHNVYIRNKEKNKGNQ
ncbi:NYN domain-containing protein [Ethanoligenens sp.]|uniref:NYN domain-containing protein n=1 Tax=Ethanoligenens sp. TaxID=2099655 RepID=UPI0039ED10C1